MGPNKFHFLFYIIGIMMGMYFIVNRGNSAKRLVEWNLKQFGMDYRKRMKLFELIYCLMGIAVILFSILQILILLD